MQAQPAIQMTPTPTAAEAAAIAAVLYTHRRAMQQEALPPLPRTPRWAMAGRIASHQRYAHKRDHLLPGPNEAVPTAR